MAGIWIGDEPAKLEQLVGGELGSAVLDGFHVLLNAMFEELLAAGEMDKVKRALSVARERAARVRIPADVPSEMHASWRTTVVGAVDYAMEYVSPIDD